MIWVRTVIQMATGSQVDELALLRQKLVETEAELQHHKRSGQSGEERFRALADAAPMMVWVAGSDALCTYVNRAWLEFRGRTLQEESGHGWTEGVHSDDRDLCLENYLKSFTARQPFRMQYRMQGSDGEYRWLEHTGAPHVEPDGTFAGFVGAAADITDRRRGVFTPDEDAVRMVFSLTERERQVLVLIAGGKSTKLAAQELGISYKTADSHRSRILEKLGVHETASLVRCAIRAGLIEP
jgi:PAS domain S-box-containing protein